MGNKTTLLFLNIIIGLLVAIIMLQRCKETKPKEIIKYDTIIKYVHIRDTIKGSVKYIHTVDTIWKKEYTPDPTYPALYKQYKQLGDEFFKKNVYTSTYKLPDSLGKVLVTDTVYANSLIGSYMVTDVKIPTTYITITKPAPPKRQLYIGGGLTGAPSSLINGASVGLIYKDRRDRMGGVSVMYNGQFQYNVSLYWKIKLRNDKE